MLSMQTRKQHFLKGFYKEHLQYKLFTKLKKQDNILTNNPQSLKRKQWTGKESCVLYLRHRTRQV